MVVAIGLLGLFLSPVAELLISRLLPRLGGLPTLRVRITTAAITGAACVALVVRFGNTAALPALILLAVLGVQLARVDIALHLLPNQLVIILLVAGVLLLAAPLIFGQQADDFLRALLSAAILFAIYVLLALISPGAIGMGDVKLAAPIGLYLGYLGWSQLLYGGLLGFIVNGISTAIIVGGKRRNKAKEVAHGPAMLGALAITALLIP
ncbi:prepilin peptidase [Arthrobacter sp. AG367]|jgi:leader peptidase (prepilin peptidase)/N-methyltransferase|uniref:prepilin peptidase n=1 Tax=Arthrobacter sp. AG367 TaxID=2572909 RepID=UPI0011A40FB6|nr:prepilin peptidase [Arthrobacter sp. AG367]